MTWGPGDYFQQILNYSVERSNERCISIDLFIYIQIYILVRLPVYLFTDMDTSAIYFSFSCIHTRIQTHSLFLSFFIYSSYAHTCTHVNTRTDKNTHTHTYTHEQSNTHTPTYTYKHTYLHIHTNTHRHTPTPRLTFSPKLFLALGMIPKTARGNTNRIKVSK